MHARQIVALVHRIMKEVIEDKQSDILPLFYRSMPHYLREMGLKFWLRLYDKNIATLKDFSGHERYENILRYLGELRTERDLLNVKLE